MMRKRSELISDGSKTARRSGKSNPFVSMAVGANILGHSGPFISRLMQLPIMTAAECCR
jgi:hypothetical protein